MGQEPDPDKMPLTFSDFPEEVQMAFFVFDLMNDIWEGMSGSYMGKDWSSLEVMLRIYEIDEPKHVVYFAKQYEKALMKHRAEEAAQERKREEARSKSQNSGGSGGTNYTHNVRG